MASQNLMNCWGNKIWPLPDSSTKNEWLLQCREHNQKTNDHLTSGTVGTRELSGYGKWQVVQPNIDLWPQRLTLVPHSHRVHGPSWTRYSLWCMIGAHSKWMDTCFICHYSSKGGFGGKGVNEAKLLLKQVRKLLNCSTGAHVWQWASSNRGSKLF